MKIKRYTIVFSLILTLSNIIYAQTDTASSGDEITDVINIQEYPLFPGCDSTVGAGPRLAFLQGLVAKIAIEKFVLPLAASGTDISGNVVVQFILEKDGRITGAEVIREAESNTLKTLEEKENPSKKDRKKIEELKSGIAAVSAEAVRIIQLLPAAISPARANGKPVRIYLAVPVTIGSY